MSRRRNGFTLLEVLVALVVLSIGLLGVGKLILFSARANDSAYLRSQATELAYTILDNMRANRQAALQQKYAVGWGPYGGPNVCTAANVPCSSDDTASTDLYRWKNRILNGGLLPGGDCQVVIVPNAAGTQLTATISVRWDDAVAQGTTASALMTITLETVL
jgi:type IV pilus assembly protein PilV